MRRVVQVMSGISFNGIWAKIIASMGATGLIAAIGAAVRLEVLAADFENHKGQPTHATDPTVKTIQDIREGLIRQEAINQKVQDTAEKVEDIDHKVDMLLMKQGLDPSKATSQ